jgi:hypothetical protein
MVADPSPFPPKPAPPPQEAARANPGFFGPVPRLEGRVMGGIRLAWNVALSAVIGIMIGGVGSWFVRGFVEAVVGPLGRSGDLTLAIVGWIAGLGSAFVLFVSYYLDDKEE